MVFQSDFGYLEEGGVETPPQIGLTRIISRRKQKKLGPLQKTAGDRPCMSWSWVLPRWIAPWRKPTASSVCLHTLTSKAPVTISFNLTVNRCGLTQLKTVFLETPLDSILWLVTSNTEWGLSGWNYNKQELVTAHLHSVSLDWIVDYCWPWFDPHWHRSLEPDYGIWWSKLLPHRLFLMGQQNLVAGCWTWLTNRQRELKIILSLIWYSRLDSGTQLPETEFVTEFLGTVRIKPKIVQKLHQIIK